MEYVILVAIILGWLALGFYDASGEPFGRRSKRRVDTQHPD